MNEGFAAGFTFKDKLLDLSLLLLFLAFSILPVVFMRVPVEASVAQSGNGNAGKPLVFLPASQKSGFSSSAKESIYAWLQLKNPFLGLTPDCEYGFRRFVDDAKARDFKYADEIGLLAPLQAEAAPLVSAKDVIVPKDEGSILLEPIMGINVTMPSGTQLPDDEGIFWLDDRGRILLNSPKVKLVDARRAMAAGQRDAIIRNTTLQVMPQEAPGLPQRIVVRKSSGNGELDRQAVSALRKHLFQARLTSGQSCIPPEGIFLEILWKLHQ